MTLSNSELLAIVVSPVFVITTTQIVRKYVKWLDGWKVMLFVFLLSETVCVVERLLTHPEQWVYGILAGLLLTTICLGTNEKINDVAKRFFLPGAQPSTVPEIKVDATVRPDLSSATHIDATDQPG